GARACEGRARGRRAHRRGLRNRPRGIFRHLRNRGRRRCARKRPGGRMIISASRRTDIPAYHAPWLMERLREGFAMVANPMNPRQARRVGRRAEGVAMVANPMNPRQVRRVDLRPEAVDGIVFWSKNPAPLLAHEKALRTYRCAWQFTLNAYAADVEPGVPGEAARLETLKRLADA